MSKENVVAFKRQDFDAWIGWAECELIILGHEILNTSYDWHAAFDRGLRPEEAAAQAASLLETAS